MHISSGQLCSPLGLPCPYVPWFYTNLQNLIEDVGSDLMLDKRGNCIGDLLKINNMAIIASTMPFWLFWIDSHVSIVYKKVSMTCAWPLVVFKIWDFRKCKKCCNIAVVCMSTVINLLYSMYTFFAILTSSQIFWPGTCYKHFLTHYGYMTVYSE
jgi:hypothetical protein